jgi:hypothetical protein
MPNGLHALIARGTPPPQWNYLQSRQRMGNILTQRENIGLARAQEARARAQEARAREKHGWAKAKQEQQERLQPFTEKKLFNEYYESEMPRIKREGLAGWERNRADLISVMKESGIRATLPPSLDELIQESLNQGMMPEAYLQYILTDDEMKLKMFKAQIEKLKAEQGLLGKWGAIKKGIDASGKPIFFQTNQAGETRIVGGVKPTPEKGMKIYDPTTGNLMIDMGGKASEKVLPAGEVGKLGEFEAYTKTLEDIEKIVKSGKADTGPFEFIKKRLDNWGIMPSSERIRLRSTVARLPGVMYAMRGKQLSDKELQVALEMMPQMSMSDEAFGITLRAFSGYLDMILKGRKKAFREAGYRMPKEKEGKTINQRGDELQAQGLSDDEVYKVLRYEREHGYFD